MTERKIFDIIETVFPFSLNSLIMLGYRGSIAHGTYVPQHIDDVDICGICIPPKDYILGLKKFEQIEIKQFEYDILIYDIRKYFRLLLNNNPNVISWLWLKDQHYIKTTKYFNLIKDRRNIFLSKKCYKSFCGYAYSQLRRMTKFSYKGYMGKKRKELVEKYGYDCKNGAHLIRLLKMGIELLIEKKVNVFREDNQLLISIKQGEWPLEKVKDYAEFLFKQIDEAYIKTDLPDEPDYEEANKLLVSIIESFFYKEG